MSQVVSAGGFTEETFDAFLATRDEPSWLTDMRREAWKQFSALELPSKNEEEWRRTDLRRFHLEKFGPPLESESSGDQVAGIEALLSHGVDLGGHTTAHNSRMQDVSLDPELAKQGVLFGNLSELLAEHSDQLRPHFMQAIDTGYDKFAALHGAFWSGGTVLYVPPGVVIDRPVHIHSTLSDGGVDLGHTLVILGEGAEATVLGETSGAADPGLHCGGIELLLASSARLRYVTLQNWGQRVWHFAHQKALLQRNAQLQWTIAALGSQLAKVNQHVALVGPGANAQVNGVMFTEGRQHMNYHTLQHHEADNCTSDLLYKGALQDHSRIVWRGMIKVDVDAQKTCGYQRNDNLLLSADARADSIPGLEIEADDVICTHGATAGRVDEEQLFYCQSRGLTRKEAVRTVVAGFFQQVFDRITIESVRDALGEAISRRVRDFL